MEYQGHAARLKPDDFAGILALMPGVEEAALRSVIDTETGGSGFDLKGRPSALFERHLFWAELGPSANRDKAAKQGLAYPHWGEKPYPKSSDGVYAEIDAACAIDENAALRSTSWGLGQILGRECGEAGFPDATSMFLAFREGEAAQLMGMVRLIKARKLDAALIKHDWVTFARSYNGSGFRKNQYDTKLADAYLKWVRKLALGPVTTAGDPVIESVQRMLGKLGLYSGAMDGLFGPLTQEALKQFQRSQPGLVVNGTADPPTKEALAKVATGPAPVVPVQKPAPAPSAPAPVVPPPKPALPAPAASPGHSTTAVVGAVGGAGLMGWLVDQSGGSHAWMWALGVFALVIVAIEIFKRNRKPA